MQTAHEPLPFAERKCLRMDDAGDYMGLGVSTVYALIKQGKLLSYKLCKARLVDRESIDRFLASREDA